MTSAARIGASLALLARVTLVLLAAAALPLLPPPGPAAAHGADAPTATDYLVQVTGVTPAVDGLRVRAVEGGARLELANHSGRTIEVLGYSGEPYLEIRPDGVYENVRSPSVYQNRTLAADTAVPDDADPTAAPQWRRVSDEPVIRWHDQRTYWAEGQPPPQVRADPDHRHRIRDWTVPLRDGVTPLEVRGTLDWIPPPDPVNWWTATLLGTVLLAGVLTAAAWRGPRTPRRISAALLAVGGLIGIGYAVARTVGVSPPDPVALSMAVFTGPIWTFATGLAALVAAGYASTRRPAAEPNAEFGLALTGICLAIFAGVANTEVFGRAIALVPGPTSWPRFALAALIALGGGVAVAALLRLRAAASDSAAAGGELAGGKRRVEPER
ncbi:hypothetical protein O7632_25830 [Solwaraspora sp. WMMD406]|uniref:hypothetical protein n=1 Tax=Solwaraspora sp. WMMD406 TaxID=3016095 RepID=UPI002417BA50|nr:hypothetical protein [Solwaraspora sp. WMMD406]MDG4767483.1 hypothetical protein [Solwaraspora sp. WMMD406]